LQADILSFLNGYQAIEHSARLDRLVSPCSPEALAPPVETRRKEATREIPKNRLKPSILFLPSNEPKSALKNEL